MKQSLKRWAVLSCVIPLLAGAVGTAGATDVFVNGVSTTTGWLDVNKNWSGDSQFCWLTSASNVLSYTGWVGAPNLSTPLEIYTDARDYWTNVAGNPKYAWQWWFTGDNAMQGASNWPQLIDTSHPGFYDNTLFDNALVGTMSTYVTANEGNMFDYIDKDYGISLLIQTTHYGPRYGHFLTLWGIDKDNDYIYVTDSDDSANTLLKLKYSGDDLVDYAWNNGDVGVWDLQALYALDHNNGNSPTPRDETNPALPEPSTWLLISSGLTAVLFWRKEGARTQ